MKAAKTHVSALLGLFLMASAASVFAFTGQELAKEAKISMEQAQAIALKAHPGKISNEELEHEKGGSGLRYTFVIQDGKAAQEVGVDAKTGKILENAPEVPNPD